MGKSQGNKVTGGLIWTFGERITAQLVSTVVGIILARVLSPEHYGVISIVTVFITFFNVFVTSGFCSAIVQKKEVDQSDYDTAFAIGLCISIIAYLILFFTAPVISDFYEMPILTNVIRVMSIRLPLAALNSIQQAYVRRKMEFKKFFISTSFGTVISGIVGILLAVKGAGVWALVIQYLTNTTIDSIVMWFVSGWRPKGKISLIKAKGIFSFGWKILASDLVATLEADIKSLVIGKSFGSSELAFYDQGKKYPALIVNNINSSINKVMLPAYSRSQDNFIALKSMLRKSIRIGLFILAPIMIGMAAVSNNFVTVILTEKWRACVPFIQIFCICYLSRPIETSCQQSILAIGRSDVTLKIMILVNSISICTMLIAAFIFKSVLLIAIGSLITCLVSLSSYLTITNKLLDYSLYEQIRDFIPAIISSLVMGCVVKIVGIISLTPFFVLIIQVITGIVSYSILSFVFQKEAIGTIFNILKRK